MKLVVDLDIVMWDSNEVEEDSDEMDFDFVDIDEEVGKGIMIESNSFNMYLVVG